jgi:putative transcriptional regulator
MKKKRLRGSRKVAGLGRPSVASRIIAGLREVKEVLERGERLEDHFTVHHVRTDLSPQAYDSSDVRALRRRLGVSQAVFARLLAVSAKTVQAWEQGSRPTPMACRLLEVIDRDPAPWLEMLRENPRKRSA